MSEDELDLLFHAMASQPRRAILEVIRAPRLQCQFRDRKFFDADWRELTKQGERNVVFQNLAHNFPHRIIYGMEADGVMGARIEGGIQGSARGVEWRVEAEK